MLMERITNALRTAKRWQRLNQAILLLLGALGYSSQSAATIVGGTCSSSGNLIATGYTTNPWPATLYSGFVLASQTVSMDVTYRKTGTNAEVLNIGVWYINSRQDLPQSSVALLSSSGQVIPGLGFRISYVPTGAYATSTPFNLLGTRSVNQAGTFTTLESFKIEFVVTDISLYSGGQDPARLAGSNLVTFVIGNVDTWTQKNMTQAGTRCVVPMIFQSGDAVTIGGVTPPVIPQPTLPTCTLGAREILVPLDPVDASQLAATGKTATTTGFTIPLGTCGKNAKPYITLTDSANLGNRTSDLTLAPSSTAKGVGIRLTKGDGSALQLGAQNTSVSANNVGQFLVGTSPADNTPMSIKLNAAYVRTAEKIEAGSVKADAIFTVAYP